MALTHLLCMGRILDFANPGLPESGSCLWGAVGRLGDTLAGVTVFVETVPSGEV